MTSPAPLTPFFYCLSGEQLQDMLDQAAERGAAAALAALPSPDQRPLAYYTAEEAAALLKCDSRKIYAAVNSGELKAKKVGRSVRISETALEAWGES